MRLEGRREIRNGIFGVLRAGAAAFSLVACSPELVGTQTAQPIPNLQPDSRGVISYASYQVAVARSGDTIDSVATRVGTSPQELATRNALPLDYRLRDGEVLLLPDGVPRGGGTDFAGGDVSTRPLDWSPERAGQAIETASAGATTATAPPGNPFRNGQTDPLIDPVRHRVEAGETAYSIARLYGVSVTALGSWNGLGPDLAVRENQELLIPIVSDANRISSSANTQPGQATAVTPPPSSADPLPENITAATELASPELGQYRTPPGGRLAPPVNAAVTRSYNPANPNGVGYSVPAGTSVRAAGDGEVALISEELGGQGTIVLIRHRDDLMTTYSTLAEVTVTKGDAVRSGQVIGVVAPRDRPELQFDVFRGTTSVDPTPYVGG
jgi:murein DD-endopeptidase MepM/ murein hydrolase activator NlpD